MSNIDDAPKLPVKYTKRGRVDKRSQASATARLAFAETMRIAREAKAKIALKGEDVKQEPKQELKKAPKYDTDDDILIMPRKKKIKSYDELKQQINDIKTMLADRQKMRDEKKIKSTLKKQIKNKIVNKSVPPSVPIIESKPEHRFVKF